MKMVAIYEIKPATKTEIKHRLKLYEKDLAECEADLKKRYKNGNPDWMPNAVEINRAECKRRIAHYIPAIKELKWVLGEV
jgi:hypothetical protein